MHQSFIQIPPTVSNHGASTTFHTFSHISHFSHFSHILRFLPLETLFTYFSNVSHLSIPYHTVSRLFTPFHTLSHPFTPYSLIHTVSHSYTPPPIPTHFLICFPLHNSFLNYKYFHSIFNIILFLENEINMSYVMPSLTQCQCYLDSIYRKTDVIQLDLYVHHYI